MAGPVSDAPEIRFVGDMTRLQPQPGDVFVLQCEQYLTDEVLSRMSARLKLALGTDAKVIVLPGGLRLGVINTKLL